MKRAAGILLPISSLPSPYGIGCFDSTAYRFIDFLSSAKQSYWQILPLGPTGFGDSPYQTYSTFAGNPYFIDLEALIGARLLTREECDASKLQEGTHFVCYEQQYKKRFPLLKKAYERSLTQKDEAFEQFLDHTPWLHEYALFMALKDAHGGAPWYAWEDELRLGDKDALEEAGRRFKEEIRYHAFLQYVFYRQWQSLKSYANQKGVSIIGDIPIYVAFDSADVWMHPELFQLNRDKWPEAIAGCPPDGFSPDGQLWGTPLYRWTAHHDTGYTWWINRLDHAFHLYDMVRIDHFRGFDEYFSIPYGDKTAHNGHWEKGPGLALFRAAEAALGYREMIAEDLGFITDSVRQLVRDSGFYSMKVLEFGFDGRDDSGNEHLPHVYPQHCVAYTGTHDNQTLAGWLGTITEQEKQQVRGYLSDHFTPLHLLCRSLIALAMRSPAQLCIIPFQDWLGLGDESRINTPSTLGQNWSWRMHAGSMGETLAREIRYVTEIFGR